MNNSQIDEAKIVISNCISDLIRIAEHGDNQHLVNKLKAQKVLLDGIDERIERNMLPESFVRSVINDIRLDVIMIYSDIKIFFTHKKQEILSPANKLEKRTHNDSIELNENKNAPGGINEFLNMERLSELEPTLKRLREIEQLLNKSFL